MEGKSIESNSFALPPRGIVWVVSKEKFCLPLDVTGLATLRTTWTHEGILALNLGVIDPGWNNHLATAVVNFSKSDFEITKGHPFFRVLFLTHKPTQSPPPSVSPDAYIEGTKRNTRLFSSTFLTMDSLIIEIAEKVLGFPRWAVRLTACAIVVSILAIILPMGIAIISQNFDLEDQINSLTTIPNRVSALENKVDQLQIKSETASSTKPKAHTSLKPPSQ